MAAFPVQFDFSVRPVLLVGSGDAASRKRRLLEEAEARVVHLPAPPFAIPHGFRFAVIALEAEQGPPEATAAAMRAAGMLINVVDRPELSDFTIPAIVRRGDIVIGIGSGGAAPLLASRLRSEIEALLPPRLGELVALAKSFRPQVSRLFPDVAARRAFWRRIFDGPVAALALQGHASEAREAMLRNLNGTASKAVGVVYLVGAGPGDPDLLTLAAQRALASADIVFHDDLVPPSILQRARRDADIVAVGKRAGRANIAQDSINAQLVAAARAGQRVVRLKAGDPFVFGRGGEERDALEAEGVTVVAVPGITAALGCAAAAGISLTHRDAASAVTLVTGHGRAGTTGNAISEAPGWAARLGKRETLVVYMGRGQAENISSGLIEAGTSGNLPVALIENGTRPDQRIAAGSLADLPALARKMGDGPVLLVLGEVARAARRHASPAHIADPQDFRESA